MTRFFHKHLTVLALAGLTLAGSQNLRTATTQSTESNFTAATKLASEGRSQRTKSLCKDTTFLKLPITPTIAPLASGGIN